MMKMVSLAAVLAVLSGCATGMSRNGGGAIYTNVKDAVTATSNSGSSKTGEACGMNILSLVSTGDFSVDAAKKAGGITKVATVDFTQKSIVGVYLKTCTVVTGE
jgi:uncharacterized protein YceK